ncbi:MAG: hypothetical protein AAFU65_17600, partial [Pseudomonadota bacterium]
MSTDQRMRTTIAARSLGLVLGPLATSLAGAQSFPEAFDTGPLIEDYGPAAEVEGRVALPDDTAFKISFDVGKQAE